MSSAPFYWKKVPSQHKKKISKRLTDSKRISTTCKLTKQAEGKAVTTAGHPRKMTLCTISSSICRPSSKGKKSGKVSSGKRPAAIRTSHGVPAKIKSAFRRSLEPCESSNDSGLGFDQHLDAHSTTQNHGMATNSGIRFHTHSGGITAAHGVHSNSVPYWANSRVSNSSGDGGVYGKYESNAKRGRILSRDIKLEEDEANDGYCFTQDIKLRKSNLNLAIIPETVDAAAVPVSLGSSYITCSRQSSTMTPHCLPLLGSVAPPISCNLPLSDQFSTHSKHNSTVFLQILKQPEQQHRARYQTEGSRGAVKDREGNGFPVVRLNGYYKPATLQVFIGTDVGGTAPHMFYQACKVSGKNSTPCTERKIDGTAVIEVQLEPTKDMCATCDCVGILKERNVDVEHRFPDQLTNRSKKKSTRCRMIFRTTLRHDDGTMETLQIGSQAIACTQPPGVPEISKKSLTSCPAAGGLELFILGKNFAKDTKVYFQQYDAERRMCWERSVTPDKEFLQQTHLVCVIPPYNVVEVSEPVTVRLTVVSCEKASEPHQFVYTPTSGAISSGPARINGQQQQQLDGAALSTTTATSGANDLASTSTNTPFFWSKLEQNIMMPPPETDQVPSAVRRSSSSCDIKHEFLDENSQSSLSSCPSLSQTSINYRQYSDSSMEAHHDTNDSSALSVNSMDGSSSLNSPPVIDLRMKLIPAPPTAVTHPTQLVDCGGSGGVHPSQQPLCNTLVDLVSTTAPSFDTLQRFSVTEHSAILPAQSAQSVESFLTKIEAPSTNVICSAVTHPAAEVATINPLAQFTVADTTNSLPRSSAQCIDSFLTKMEVPGTTVVPPPITTAMPMSVAPVLETLTGASNVQNRVVTAEKTVIFHAAADLLHTQKQISQLNKLSITSPNAIPMEFVESPPTASQPTNALIPIPVKEMEVPSPNILPGTANNMSNTSSNDISINKKSNEQDRMIPQSFTSLTENELINLINPSCFDQV